MIVNKIKSINSQKNMLSASTVNFMGSKEESYTNNGITTTLKMTDKNNIAQAINISNVKSGAKWILKFNDPKYKGFRILLSSDSEIKSKNGKFMISIRNQEKPTFTGNIYGSIRSDKSGKDENMRNAYLDFWKSGLKNYLETNHVDREAQKSIKDDYSFFIPSDGDGTRYRDMTSLQGDIILDEDNNPVIDKNQKYDPVLLKNEITKPASEIPISIIEGSQMKLVQGVLTNFAKTGQLKDVDFVEVEPANGSAFAFFEGLKNGQIPTDKPLVFVWGDNFSDIKIQPIMQFHEKTEADFTMLALPVKRERIGALGAVQVESEDNMRALWFMEKPDTEEDKDKAKLGNKNEYLGVVGPYILSSRVLKWIKEEYTKNPENFYNNKKFDFSSIIIDKLINQKDKLGLDFNVQVYKKPKDETWSDLGSSKDFKTEMMKIKYDANAYKYLPLEYKASIMEEIDDDNNIAINTGALKKLENLKAQYGLDIENVFCYLDK